MHIIKELLILHIAEHLFYMFSYMLMLAWTDMW
jgi:hypothetical protein